MVFCVGVRNRVPNHNNCKRAKSETWLQLQMYYLSDGKAEPRPDKGIDFCII